jgi:hypothetical protein
MPVYTAPNGFEPVQRRDGLPYAGVVREYPIATGYGTQLRRGDLVMLLSTGALIKWAGTTGVYNSTDTTDAGILGVFMGCSYTDAVLGKTFRTYWTASTAAADAMAMVVDDPEVIFRAVYVSSGVTVSAQTYAATIGKNVSVIQNTTKTATSDIAISGVNTTSTLPFRVVDVDKDSAATATTYTALFITYGITFHAWTCATGVA